MSSNNAVELKGGMYTFMSLRLCTSDLDAVDAALADKVHQAPAFFKDTPVVVDLSGLEEGTELDGEALLACIRRHRLDPIVASLADKSSSLAGSIALPLIERGARRRVSVAPPSGDVAEGAGTATRSGSEETIRRRSGGAAEADAPGPGGEREGGSEEDRGGSAGHGSGEGGSESGGGSIDGAAAELALSREVDYVIRAPLLVDRPVRSGQQIYARGTDLIIMGQVGAGAEVIADNNIHVYGPLRGRALCGVSGNADTRIFCQSLEAELVSVAGNYRMLETIPEELRGRPAQIWLDEDRLNIEPL